MLCRKPPKSSSSISVRLPTKFASALEGAAAPIAMHMVAAVMLVVTMMPADGAEWRWEAWFGGWKLSVSGVGCGG